MRKGTLANTVATAVAALAACVVVLGAGPRTDDDLVDQTEDNQNSQSVITLPGSGPIIVF
ncbi:hypothetical protein V4U86_09695 [Mycobacterium sp. AMU20-3851]|uniref:hypothetical protein n=1 Tax=Mycobacterium sp. AMU20-3851 TaxID=3122055 RepID=UPI00375473A6